MYSHVSLPAWLEGSFYGQSPRGGLYCWTFICSVAANNISRITIGVTPCDFYFRPVFTVPRIWKMKANFLLESSADSNPNIPMDKDGIVAHKVVIDRQVRRPSINFFSNPTAILSVLSTKDDVNILPFQACASCTSWCQQCILLPCRLSVVLLVREQRRHKKWSISCSYDVDMFCSIAGFMSKWKRNKKKGGNTSWLLALVIAPQ